MGKVKSSRSLIRSIIIAAVVVLIAFGVFIYNATDISHQAVSIRLKLLCEGIYEYRAATGHWPAQTADLAGTAMAARMRFWDDDIRSGRVVVLWPQGWPPNPQDNADKILAYYNKGLISEFGKQWVCWGDLRTEYVSTEKLQALLKTTDDLTARAQNSKLETRN